MVSKLLGCAPDDLEHEITYRGTIGDAKRSVCTPTEAFNQRDTLAKTLYNNLFVWLVTKMNRKILDDASLLTTTNPDIKTVGLLDIFGFECFQLNDYEQLLINYTNEKLQKLYLNAVFEAEKITFKEEGLAHIVGKLVYTDRTTIVIEMLDNKTPQKPQGIFNKIDDYKKNEDAKNLKAGIAKDFEKHESYQRHKDADKFVIRHTAKLVIYSAKEFIEKNLDRMSDDLKTMMYERMEPSISAILKSVIPSISIFIII
jgi:myosin-5